MESDILKFINSQVDFSSKPTFWKKLHPQIKVKVKIHFLMIHSMPILVKCEYIKVRACAYTAKKEKSIYFLLRVGFFRI